MTNIKSTAPKFQFTSCKEEYLSTSNQFHTRITISAVTAPTIMIALTEEQERAKNAEMKKFEKLLESFTNFGNVDKEVAVESETYYLGQREGTRFTFLCLTRTVKTSLQRIKKFLLKHGYEIINEDYKGMITETERPSGFDKQTSYAPMKQSEQSRLPMWTAPIIALVAALVGAGLTSIFLL